jgi:acetyl-CoA/propionyl-CoA carboxylase biotin carboxyl carrier protein
MLRALAEYEIEGPATLIGFHRALLEHPCFGAGETCHGLVESEELAARAAQLVQPTSPSDSLLLGNGRLRPHLRAVEVDGRRFEVRLLEPEPPWRELARRRRERGVTGGAGGVGRDAVVSPMQGTVLAVEVAEGDEVVAGQVICVIEAMKMENEVHASRAGTIAELSVSAGEAVTLGQVICVVTSNGVDVSDG